MARSHAFTASTTCYVERKQQATHAFVLRARLEGRSARTCGDAGPQRRGSFTNRRSLDCNPRNLDSRIFVKVKQTITYHLEPWGRDRLGDGLDSG